MYDNLERAAAAEGGEDDPHKKGLEMIFHQYQGAACQGWASRRSRPRASHLTRSCTNAVMHIEDENLGENVVAQVFQAGFELGGKVIRHAIVQVAN